MFKFLTIYVKLKEANGRELPTQRRFSVPIKRRSKFRHPGLHNKRRREQTTGLFLTIDDNESLSLFTLRICVIIPIDGGGALLNGIRPHGIGGLTCDGFQLRSERWRYLRIA